MTLHILSQLEAKKVLEKLREQFGVKKIPGILIMRGEERIFLFTGNTDEKELKEIENIVYLERAGIYFGKEELGQIRLSIEGTQILSEQITKNVFKLQTSEQFEQWMSGQELLISSGFHGVIAIKYQNDFLGCGKASENKISNFIPKNRRLKLKTTIK